MDYSVVLVGLHAVMFRETSGLGNSKGCLRLQAVTQFLNICTKNHSFLGQLITHFEYLVITRTDSLSRIKEKTSVCAEIKVYQLITSTYLAMNRNIHRVFIMITIECLDLSTRLHIRAVTSDIVNSR
jgi:hypothetical protein